MRGASLSCHTARPCSVKGRNASALRKGRRRGALRLPVACRRDAPAGEAEQDGRRGSRPKNYRSDKQEEVMRRNTKIRAAVVSALAAGAGSTAVTAVQAQEAPNERAIEEIVVTATKRQESMQDVPVAVSALQGDSLEELRIDSFDDYALYLPNVTSQGTGPGQQEIYIRGAATSQTIISLSSVQGLQPSVALYVDEQPVALQGRNLDVYATDLARIEVLPGPQGTLFGASSQAGTVRLITNKPDFSGTYGRLKAGTSWTKGGEMSNNVEGMFNLPVSDKLALRGVVYTDNMGGYVDNVPGTLTARESARFRPAGTVRPNGVAVSE